MKTPPPRPARSFWRFARVTFRWCRIAVWLVLLAALCLLIWLHQHGLPAFARDMVVGELRARGVGFTFERLRLVWYRGLVADDIASAADAAGRRTVRGSAAEATLSLRLREVLRGRLAVEGVSLRGGRVVLTVWGTNDRPQEVVFDKLNGDVRFRAGDTWELGDVRAECFGVPLRLTGTVSNAPAMRGWKFGLDRPRERTAASFWNEVIHQLEQTRFAPGTEVTGALTGDAERIESFRVNLHLRSAGLESPHGRGTNVEVSAQIRPREGTWLYAEVKAGAQSVETSWGRAASLELEGNVAPSLTHWAPTNAFLRLDLRRADTPWGRAGTVQVRADFRPNPSDAASALAAWSVRGQQVVLPHGRFAQAELGVEGVVAASNAWPRSAVARLVFSGGEVRGLRAASGDMTASLVLPAWEEMRAAMANEAWWAPLERVQGDVKAAFQGLSTGRIESTNVTFSARWQPPLLTVPDATASGFGGVVRGAGRWHTGTRWCEVEAQTDFDPKRAGALLGTNLMGHLADFDWERAPRARVTAGALLPAWTNAAAWRALDWRRDVRPTLALSGQIELGPGSYRGIAVDLARSDFSYTNGILRVPNLVAHRPGEQLRVAHVLDEATGDFSLVIDSTIQPRLLRPWLPPAALEVMDEFEVTTAPVIRAELAGRLGRPETWTAGGSIAATNFSFRQRALRAARADLTFTNNLLTAVAPVVHRAEGVARADSVAVDVAAGKIHIRNATGRIHVADLTHMIGGEVEKTMAPYVFPDAPEGRAEGVVDVHDALRCNLRFQVRGGAFEWRDFKFQRFTGDIHWAGTTLALSNTAGVMHGGNVDFSALFDFTAPRGVGFSFQADARAVDFHALMSDLHSPTNRLEGALGGRLTVHRANTEEPRSWFGSGYVTLDDGLVWDVPAFGLFSPVLNSIKPGAGNSRAREVRATFLITNSVIASDDLVIDASGMRLNYNGTVDFDTRLNARLEAQLFRNAPGVGALVATVFWPVTKLFEYRVTGTLARPKSEPVYIPKVLMVPFHPVRSIRELLGDEREPGPGPGP